jgi:arylsulfatase A-like enzyme
MGLTHADFGWGLSPGERHAAALFAEAGYQSWLAFAQHETNDPAAVGYERILQHGPTYLGLPAQLDAALAERDRGRPMYLQMGFGPTHRPYDADGVEPDESLGITVPPYLLDGPGTREELAQLQGMVRRYDEGMGMFLDVLDQHGLRENTILVLTTDHGLAMPMAKGTLYDPGLETLLMMRCSGRWGAGQRRSEMISNVDILPTLLEACGIDLPENIQGRSFLPLLDGNDYEPNETIFAEKTFHGCYDPMRCVRTEQHKYIRFFEKATVHPVPGDIMFGGACLEMPRAMRRRACPEELYDLRVDPNERTNLAEDPAHAEVLSQLRGRLARWMRDTGDPLLDGPVASPYYDRAVRQMRAALAEG